MVMFSKKRNRHGKEKRKPGKRSVNPAVPQKNVENSGEKRDNFPQSTKNHGRTHGKTTEYRKIMCET